MIRLVPACVGMAIWGLSVSSAWAQFTQVPTPRIAWQDRSVLATPPAPPMPPAAYPETSPSASDLPATPDQTQQAADEAAPTIPEVPAVDPWTAPALPGPMLHAAAPTGATLPPPVDLQLESLTHNRLFVQVDMLLWAVSRPDITTVGDAGSEGLVTVGGNTYYRSNSLDTGFISSDWSLGGRIEAGRFEDDHGWTGSVLFYRHEDATDRGSVWFVPSDPFGMLDGYQDSNNDDIDDDVNGNQIHGRDGEDLGTPDNSTPGAYQAPFDGDPDQAAPTDAGDLVRYLATFSSFSASNRVELTGFELMDAYRMPSWDGRTLDWSWGLRYLEFRDRFAASGSGGVLGSSSLLADSNNEMLGPQLAVRWTANRPWVRVTAEGRFLAAINFQKDRLNGSLGGGATYGGRDEPVAMEATSFQALQSNTGFSPVGEWRLEASYYANSWLAFRLGYTGMVIGGVGRASERVSYSLPAFGLTDGGSSETVLTNGLNLGFEINR